MLGHHGADPAHRAEQPRPAVFFVELTPVAAVQMEDQLGSEGKGLQAEERVAQERGDVLRDRDVDDVGAAAEREARVRPVRPSPASTEHAAGGDALGDSQAPDPGASRPSASGESPSPTAGFRGSTGPADVHRSPDSRQII